MGGTSYNSDMRALRAKTLDYAQASPTNAKVFRQNAKRCVNEGMDPSQISLREARDSAAHPLSVPVILQLDVTGSMGRIPAQLIAGDLPHLMGHLVGGECPDAALMFTAAGDLYSDQAPFQVGQFESGDAELDHWLTTTWLEANGGGNGGESYSLSWLFALNMVKTDAWDKRGERGLIISIGDEPLHDVMPTDALRRVFGNQYDKLVGGFENIQNGITARSVFEWAVERWNIHHIDVSSQSGGGTFIPRGTSKNTTGWGMLGESYHLLPRDQSIVEKIREIIKQHMALCDASRGDGSAAPAVAAPSAGVPAVATAACDTYGGDKAPEEPVVGQKPTMPDPL